MRVAGLGLLLAVLAACGGGGAWQVDANGERDQLVIDRGGETSWIALGAARRVPVLRRYWRPLKSMMGGPPSEVKKEDLRLLSAACEPADACDTALEDPDTAGDPKFVRLVVKRQGPVKLTVRAKGRDEYADTVSIRYRSVGPSVFYGIRPRLERPPLQP